MARQTSSITFVKKFGNMVGSKGMDGKFNARLYIPGEDIKDAKTPTQVYNRAKMALAAKVAGMLGVMGEQVLVANGLKATRRGMLVRSIYARINDAVTGPELGANLDLVLNPRGSMSVDPTIRYAAPSGLLNGTVKFKVSCTPEEGDLQRVIVCLLVYNSTKQEWRNTVRAFPASAATMEVTTFIPPNWAGDTVVSYGYTMGILTDEQSAVVTSIGDLTGTTEAIAMGIDSNNVAYGALLYTQINATVETSTFPES